MKYFANLILIASYFLATPANANQASLVSINTPRGIVQKFILIKPKKPTAAVILLVGGDGRLGLKGKNSIKRRKNNFLVRTRNMFAAKGMMVAVVDTPSDRPKMSTKFRMSNKHAGDISAITQYLKEQANIPVWLVGTSRGTFSAANGGFKSTSVDGVVLSATVTRVRNNKGESKKYCKKISRRCRKYEA